jgi:hypothetical protein
VVPQSVNGLQLLKFVAATNGPTTGAQWVPKNPSDFDIQYGKTLLWLIDYCMVS